MRLTGPWKVTLFYSSALSIPATQAIEGAAHSTPRRTDLRSNSLNFHPLVLSEMPRLPNLGLRVRTPGNVHEPAGSTSSAVPLHPSSGLVSKMD